MRKNSFVLYTDCLEQLEVIPDAERGILFLEVLRYARTGVVPNIENPFLKALFLGFKNQIDRDCAKYDEVCKKRAEAGRKGGNQRVANLEQMKANGSTCNQNQASSNKCLNVEAKSSTFEANQADNNNGSDNDNGSDSDIKNKRDNGKTFRFAPPSLQEVEKYINEKGYSIDAEAFIAFYESKGWYIGKNKMKSWKYAITTWEKREREQKTKCVPRKFISNANDEWK